LLETVLPDGVNREERDPFDGVDTGITSLAAFAGPQAPAALSTTLERIRASVADARKAFASAGPAATVPALVRGLSAVRELRTNVSSMSVSADARYEIEHRLRVKDIQFSEALRLASGVQLDAVARDGLVVPGQTVQVELMIANRGGDIPVMISRRSLAGFEALAAPCKDDVLLRGPETRSACSIEAQVPPDTRLTAAHFKYATDAERFVVDPDVPAGLPFRPTPFTATFVLNIAGADVTTTLPVQFRSERDIFSGEKRAEIHVVPKFAVSVSPEIAVVPAAVKPVDTRSGPGASAAARDIRVTVTNHATGPAKADVRLEAPKGWTVTPASAPIAFTREDESMTVRFKLAPPSELKPSVVLVKAHVVEGTARFDQGYQVIEYPHTTRRHVLRAPEVPVKVLDVKVKPSLTIGYVTGVGDEIPPALEQLGARVEFLEAEDLAWRDLKAFDVIMTGVRAYERRADLRAHNQRLIEYARAGGTVIVNYNKFEFNEAQYGPYPAKVGRDRVTDENSVVRVLQPQHPVFTTPNRIADADWKGWVQERGLYFLDTAGRDAQLVDLLELEDPFPYNKGAKRGALVEAKVGQGRWIYVGLGLWRQLPAGTEGAFRLLANLISLD
jgi:hypothetical protein